jgi:hypothetical protein
MRERRGWTPRWLDRLAFHCARFAHHYARPEIPSGTEPD